MSFQHSSTCRIWRDTNNSEGEGAVYGGRGGREVNPALSIVEIFVTITTCWSICQLKQRHHFPSATAPIITVQIVHNARLNIVQTHAYFHLRYALCVYDITHCSGTLAIGIVSVPNPWEVKWTLRGSDIRDEQFYVPSSILSQAGKKYICTNIHKRGLAYGKLPYTDETFVSMENQRVAKLTKIAGRWHHYTERTRRGGGKNGRDPTSPPYA